MSSEIVHRWYARPVFFVADVNRALHFYVDSLGFEKARFRTNCRGGDTT